MSIFEAVVLGLVQGLTEFIPVSSSGHLLLAHKLFGSTDATLAFDVALHVGTLLALLVYFYRDIIGLAKNIFSSNQEGKLARLLILATIPAAVAGLLFNGFIEDKLRSEVVVAVSLAVVGVLMLIADSYTTTKPQKEVGRKQGMLVGLAQMLALIPGVSRSGITITAGLFTGMTRSQAARFSFLLAIPIIAGSALGILLRDGIGAENSANLIAGMVIAFISGLLAIRFFLSVVTKVGLKPFAVYRILLATIVLVIVIVE